MSQETFFNYRKYYYLWLNSVILLLLTLIYVVHEPPGGPNGGTIIGYTFGGLATLGILYLMWYGIRKRSYHAHKTTLKGTLAAHVWIGIALLLLVPLHSGFQFGVNVHTLAYLLMVIVILSGIWGAVNYSTLAPQIQAHRGGGAHKELVQQIEALSGEIQRTLQTKSDDLVHLVQKIDVEFNPSVSQSVRRRNRVQTMNSELAGELLAELPRERRAEGIDLIELVNKKLSLMNRLAHDVAVMYRLKVWLYIHIPVSFALLAALAIHIFSVFFYW